MPVYPSLRSDWKCSSAVTLAVLVMFLIGLVINIPGCGDPVDRDYEHIYTVRGRVISLPGATPGRGFTVHHETIPDYVAANGSIGMDAMVMSFAVPTPSVIEGLAVGDIIEVVYGESLSPRVKQGVISVRVLPAETVLEFDVEPGELPADEG